MAVGRQMRFQYPKHAVLCKNSGCRLYYNISYIMRVFSHNLGVNFILMNKMGNNTDQR